MSPQYHVVFDDKFKTASHMGSILKNWTKFVMSCLVQVGSVLSRKSMMRMEVHFNTGSLSELLLLVITTTTNGALC